MSITKNHLIFDTLNIIRAGQQSNSEAISESQVGYWWDNVRALFIRRDLDKKRSINPDIIQTLCVDLTIADASDCPCEVAGCTILKSALPIPSAIELSYRNLITSVGPINMTERRFNFMPYNRAIWYNPNKFSQSIPGAFVHNGHLFVIASDNKADFLEVITMDIVLERPEDAASFTCQGTPCYTVNSVYPISTVMIEDAKAYIISNNLKIAATAPSDLSGNAEHNLESPIEK